ncbi:J domain-containing protein [Chitinophaga sp. Cy-1792]|uniref:J domain-containing protein n=1 Tax=Chitinophaga sp. Cy-1792 TaxID=2608339 RepID=UPI00141DA238|nr:J domain-containing protein [Chitinophaga sp. Cy-1792]NIG56455.1 J domain-containing protein [Chitinophaga sp. Cy-1792]
MAATLLSMMNYYSILELPYFAGSEDVKKAHRRLSKKYHPDLNPGNAVSEEKFKQVQHAYEQLNNPDRKAYYDELLRLNLYRSQQTTSNTGTAGSHQQTEQQQEQYSSQQYYTREETDAEYQRRHKYDMEDDLPPDTRKDIFIKLGIIGLFMLIIALGAIFGKREPSLPKNLNNETQASYDPTDDPVVNELGIDQQSSKAAIREKLGKPLEVYQAEHGMEMWTYPGYLLFFQDGKFVTVVKIKKAPADSAE